MTADRTAARSTGDDSAPRQHNGVLLAMIVVATSFFLFWGGGLAGDERVRWLSTFIASAVITGLACVVRYLWAGRKQGRELAPGWLAAIGTVATLVRVFLPPTWIAVVVGVGLGVASLGLFRVVVPPLTPRSSDAAKP